MASEGNLYAMPLEGFWMDVGQPKDFVLGLTLYLPHLMATEPNLFPKHEGLIHPVLVVRISRIFSLSPFCRFAHIAGPKRKDRQELRHWTVRVDWA
jgi:hypothetical protein